MRKTRTSATLLASSLLTAFVFTVGSLAIAAQGNGRALSSGTSRAWSLYRSGRSKTAAASPFVHSAPRPVKPFPIILNKAVERYVNAYLSQPTTLEAAFQRSRPFLPRMVEILENHGVPSDFVYLAFAESLFTKRGLGPWQFDRSTARRFGLHINRWVDERRDPILSTKAAAEYLARLHDEADKDWRVAVIVWNLGPGALDRYWILEGNANYRKFVDRLPERTRQLLQRFMAVAFIAHNAPAYGIRVNYSDSVGYRSMRVRGGTSFLEIARKYHTTVSELRNLNPAIIKDRVPPYARAYPVRLPIAKHRAPEQRADAGPSQTPSPEF